MTDAAGSPSLLQRMLAGDESAFGELITGRALRLRVVIRQLAGSAARADCDEEDLFQLVVFRAWQLREGFVDRGPGSFHRWLIALARNIIGDRMRYLNTKGREKGRHYVTAASIASAIPDSITSISSRSARSEDAKRVEDALAKLEPQVRDAVQLYYFEGLSLSQVAERCGRPRSTLWEELKKALEELRSVLPDEKT